MHHNKLPNRAVRRHNTRRAIRRRLNRPWVWETIYTTYDYIYPDMVWRSGRVRRLLTPHEVKTEHRGYLKNETKNEFFSFRSFYFRDWDVTKGQERAKRELRTIDQHEFNEELLGEELSVFNHGLLRTKRRRGQHRRKCRLHPQKYTW